MIYLSVRIYSSVWRTTGHVRAVGSVQVWSNVSGRARSDNLRCWMQDGMNGGDWLVGDMKEDPNMATGGVGRLCNVIWGHAGRPRLTSGRGVLNFLKNAGSGRKSTNAWNYCDRMELGRPAIRLHKGDWCGSGVATNSYRGWPKLAGRIPSASVIVQLMWYSCFCMGK